jgi:hypothetical protein
MRQMATIFKVLGLISLMLSSIVLGSLYSDTVRHLPTPVASISGSLG